MRYFVKFQYPAVLVIPLLQEGSLKFGKSFPSYLLGLKLGRLEKYQALFSNLEIATILFQALIQGVQRILILE